MPSYNSVAYVYLVFFVSSSYFDAVPSEELIEDDDQTSNNNMVQCEFTSSGSVPIHILNRLVVRNGTRDILRNSTKVVVENGTRILVGNGVRMSISNITKLIISNGIRMIIRAGMGESLNETRTQLITAEEEQESEENLTYYNNLLNDTWLNLISVMDLFTQREYDNESSVQALTAAYRYTVRQQKKLKTLPSYLKKPFIAIEGLDREKRDTLAKRLALHLQGYVVLNPPDTFEVVLKNLPANSSILTNGFYVLSTYIAALHVRYVVQRAPAIVPGYWLGRAAFSMARHFDEKPPPYESKFWAWPRDMVKPDIVFYLTDRYSLHQFEDHKFIGRYLHVFDNWVDPRCIPLVNTQNIDSMMEEIEPYLQRL